MLPAAVIVIPAVLSTAPPNETVDVLLVKLMAPNATVEEPIAPLSVSAPTAAIVKLCALPRLSKVELKPTAPPLVMLTAPSMVTAPP